MIKQKQCYAYQPLFCEENIYHLARDLTDDCKEVEAKVLFFISTEKTVAMFEQTSFGDSGIGCWDYHVVLFAPVEKTIVDFDSRLGFCTNVLEYFGKSFPPQNELEESLRVIIREIDAPVFLDSFWSDRSHMKNSTGQPLAAFPPWPAILNSRQSLRLVDLSNAFFDDQRIKDQSVSQFLDKVGK